MIDTVACVLNDMSPVDEAAVRAYRLGRLRGQMAAADVAAIVLFDPVNVRYANGTRNMQVWTMHNFCRYACIATDGPSVMFELPSCLMERALILCVAEGILSENNKLFV